MFFALIIIAFLWGMLFFPVLLSLVGPRARPAMAGDKKSVVPVDSDSKGAAAEEAPAQGRRGSRLG